MEESYKMIQAQNWSIQGSWTIPKSSQKVLNHISFSLALLHCNKHLFLFLFDFLCIFLFFFFFWVVLILGFNKLISSLYKLLRLVLSTTKSKQQYLANKFRNLSKKWGLLRNWRKLKLYLTEAYNIKGTQITNYNLNLNRKLQ